MTSRSLALLGLVVLASCAPRAAIVTESATRERPAPPPAPVPPPAPPPAPLCPEPMRKAVPLEALLGEALRPGTWHPEASADALGFGGSWRETFSVPLGREVTAFGAFTRNIGAIVFTVPHAGGACIVNAWTVYFPGNLTGLSLAGAWVSPSSDVSVLLAKLHTQDAPSGQAIHLALATDGTKAWQPLGAPGRHQLLARSVVLRPSGKKLYLDVTLHRTTVFVLRPSGKFEQLGR